MIRNIALAAMLLMATPAFAEPIVATPAEQAQLDALQQPEDWFIAHLKGEREVQGGVALDVRLQWVLENVTRPASAPAVQTWLRNSYKTADGRAAARAALDRYWFLHTAAGPDMKSVEDRSVTGRDGQAIPIRIYYPTTGRSHPPVIVYYHGGGFMFGSIDAWDPAVRLIADQARAIVISVGYRLAPENPYPAAWNDAEDAYLWAVDHAESLGGAGVALAGDSAGGTLAIATALRVRNSHRTLPVGLLLFYPGVDRAGDYPSMHQFATGYGLDADNLKYLADQVYPAGVVTALEDTSPMQAADLCGMGYTDVVEAGFDPLRDSQTAFVTKRPGFGVSCSGSGVSTLYGSLIHGFLQTTAYVPDARRAAGESAESFGNLLFTAIPDKP